MGVCLHKCINHAPAVPVRHQMNIGDDTVVDKLFEYDKDDREMIVWLVFRNYYKLSEALAIVDNFVSLSTSQWSDFKHFTRYSTTYVNDRFFV